MSKRLTDLRVNADEGTVTKTEVEKCLPLLPREIVFEILSLIPAKVIHDKRHVYEEWKSMTDAKDFVYYHVRNSTPGIILLENYKNYGVYVEVRRGCLEICKFDCGSMWLVSHSVNGLALAISADKPTRDKQILYVFNPLTRQRVVVPYDTPMFFRPTLAFAEASNKFKVVHPCPHKSSWCLGLLTVGVDKEWRYIGIEHLSIAAQSAIRSLPYVTHGYVHWINSSIVLTLNVETETISEFSKPPFPLFRLLAMGRNLACYHLSGRPQFHEYLMKVREMNPETGEWTMLVSSDLKPLSDRFKDFNSTHMFGTLDCREVFLFGIAGPEKFFAAYNVRTREIQSFQLGKSASKFCPRPHVNSMVWLD